jgi:hypothetical protein
MLTVTNSGLVEVVSLQETIPLAWSPLGDVSFGYGKYLIESSISDTSDSDHKSENTTFYDISTEMKKRAIQGYSTDVSYVIFIQFTILDSCK